MAKKILVIEDQPPILKLISSRLKSQGYLVLAAEDGQMGIEMIKAENPDLIITDLAMPKIPGNVVVRIVKQSKNHSHIPVIMLSAFIHGGEKETVEIPADEYIPKPFDGDLLLAKVKALLEK